MPFLWGNFLFTGPCLSAFEGISDRLLAVICGQK